VFYLETDELTEDERSRQDEMLHDTIVHYKLRVVKYSSKCLVKHVARTNEKWRAYRFLWWILR